MAIKGAVPQPGATFPYSEFNGFNKGKQQKEP